MSCEDACLSCYNLCGFALPEYCIESRCGGYARNSGECETCDEDCDDTLSWRVTCSTTVGVDDSYSYQTVLFEYFSSDDCSAEGLHHQASYQADATCQYGHGLKYMCSSDDGKFFAWDSDCGDLAFEIQEYSDGDCTNYLQRTRTGTLEDDDTCSHSPMSLTTGSEANGMMPNSELWYSIQCGEQEDQLVWTSYFDNACGTSEDGRTLTLGECTEIGGRYFKAFWKGETCYYSQWTWTLGLCSPMADNFYYRAQVEPSSSSLVVEYYLQDDQCMGEGFRDELFYGIMYCQPGPLYGRVAHWDMTGQTPTSATVSLMSTINQLEEAAINECGGDIWYDSYTYSWVPDSWARLNSCQQIYGTTWYMNTGDLDTNNQVRVSMYHTEENCSDSQEEFVITVDGSTCNFYPEASGVASLDQQTGTITMDRNHDSCYEMCNPAKLQEMEDDAQNPDNNEAFLKSPGCRVRVSYREQYGDDERETRTCQAYCEKVDQTCTGAWKTQTSLDYFIIPRETSCHEGQDDVFMCECVDPWVAIGDFHSCVEDTPGDDIREECCEDSKFCPLRTSCISKSQAASEQACETLCNDCRHFEFADSWCTLYRDDDGCAVTQLLSLFPTTTQV